MITFEITYDQCTIVVCTTFESILGLLGQIVFLQPYGGVWDPPLKKSKITQNQNWWPNLDRYWFLDHNGSKFFKIRKKLTELWPFKEIKAITKLPLSQFRILEKKCSLKKFQGLQFSRFWAEIWTVGTKPYFSVKLLLNFSRIHYWPSIDFFTRFFWKIS